MEAAPKAVEPPPFTTDVAVQADHQPYSLQTPPQTEQGIWFPPEVKNLFYPHLTGRLGRIRAWEFFKSSNLYKWSELLQYRIEI